MTGVKLLKKKDWVKTNTICTNQNIQLVLSVMIDINKAQHIAPQELVKTSDLYAATNITHRWC